MRCFGLFDLLLMLVLSLPAFLQAVKGATLTKQFIPKKRVIAVAMTLAISHYALAQTPPASKTDAPIQHVVITGSNLNRIEWEYPSPGTIMDREGKSAEFRTLIGDLATAIRATADKLHAQGNERYAPGSYQRASIDRVRTNFERFSHIPAPTTMQILSSGHELGRLAEVGPELYASVVNEPAMLARIHSAERDLGMRVFAPPELISQGLKIISDLVVLTKTKTTIARSADKEEQESDADLDNVVKELKRASDWITAGNITNRYFAAQTGETIYRVYGKLRSTGRISNEALDTQIMSYLLEANGSAYRYYRLHAFYGDNYALANRLGAMFLTKYCQDTANFYFSCFTVMTQTAFNHFRLHDSENYRASLQKLDKALAKHQQLRLAVAPQAHMSPGTEAERRKKVLLELQSYVPNMDRFMGDSNREEWQTDEMESMLAMFMEVQAASYWITRADGKNFPRLAKAMAEARNEDFADAEWALLLIGGAYTGALQVADYNTALAAISGVRDMMTAHTEEDGTKIDTSSIDMMQVQALYGANQLKEARKLARKMRRSSALRQPLHRAVSAPVAIFANCRSAASFVPDNGGQQSMSAEQYVLSKIEMKIALKLGERVPPGAVRKLLEYEARELFRRASGGDEEEQPPLPSVFVANWPEYSKAVATNKAALRQLATATKCLLARPDMVERLGLDFVNKSNSERQTLNSAIFAILKDSGMFEQHGTAIGNEDYVLLQAASIMQAHNGISSSAARSVFASSEMRNGIKNAEISIAQFSDQLNKLGSGLHLSKMFTAIGAGSAAGFDQMLSVMADYPVEFAKYAALRNQSIATLDAVKKTLKADEAAMLMTLFDRKLVSVVVRHDSARVLAVDTSRKEMKGVVAALQTSVNFLSQQDTRLPPDYRADIAWKLYKQLFKPVEASLAGVNSVYLVAGEDLALIPFAALVTSAPPAQSAVDFSTYRQLRWLGDRYAFVSLPSVHALLKSAAANNQDSAKLLGVGEPAVASQVLIDLSLSPMPDTSSLLNRAGKPIDPPPLLRAKANYADLLAASNSGTLSNSDMALINSHALAAGQSEKYGTQEPAILLAPTSKTDGADFLDPSKVMSLKLSLRLVMLLACETAGGRTKENSQPYAGLVNSFFFAGADSVVATNLPVDPAVAEDFAVRFLHYVRDDKKSSAKALQMAAADVRCAQDSMACAAGEKYVWAHPAYWSQFTLVGSGR